MLKKIRLPLIINVILLIFLVSSCENKEEKNISTENPYLKDWPQDVPIPPSSQFTGITRSNGFNNYNFQATGKPMRVYEVYKSLIEQNGFKEQSNTMNEDGGQVIWVKGTSRRVIFAVFRDKQTCIITIERN
jgi:hypothetical protein